MATFHLFESDKNESDFRWQYSSIREAVALCFNSISKGNRCENACHYLLSGDMDATCDGFPAVFGLDCDVEVLSWGGDIEDVSVEVYCRECAGERHRVWLAQQEINRLRNEQDAKEREHRELNEARFRRASLSHWLSLSDIQFEIECAKLFEDLGFSTKLTPVSNDGGIDILLWRDGKSGAAQCKAWKQTCGVKELREFNGTLHSEGMSFGYFIARGGFTSSARLLLRKMPLITGWGFEELIKHHHTGAQIVG